MDELSEGRAPRAWLGREVVVGIRGEENLEDRPAAGMFGKLEDVHDGGVVLSMTAEPRLGANLFYPWSAVRSLRLRAAPIVEDGEDPGAANSFAPMGQGGQDPQISASGLTKVVAINQKKSVGEITVALTAIELYGGGHALLRYLISYGTEGRQSILNVVGIPEPEVRVLDTSGIEYQVRLEESEASDTVASGMLLVTGLPKNGGRELRVEFVRIADERALRRGVQEPGERSWAFSFSV